jgi:type IIS restriction endonuclease
MNKELLKEYLSNRYQGWESFLNNIIFPIFGKDDFEDGYEAELLDSQPKRRKLATITGIRSIKQVGRIYVGVEPLQIFDVTVSDRVMMERNRVNIQRLIRTVMDQFSCAFMLFHYEDDTRWDWRFTYCRKSAKKEETTDSKRFTFLLGPGQSCRTAADNFIALYEKRDSLEIKNIEEAFNVEALSQEFFGKYKAQYEAFVNYMVGPANGMRQDFIDTHFDHSSMTADKIRDREEKPIRDYVKKLLGRIVFLHFLQKKGWLGVPTGKEWGEGDRDFMLKLFENASPEQKENFLDEVLEGLFANGLDTNRSDNGDVYDTGVQGFCNCRIPYLNGGLFERDELDEKTSRFPAKYFESLLTMLSQYNFTIDENDPNDAEVGVDPEMLGRIFENLLEDNKDKGAFYTPKEIVQYMCRESLIAYLQTGQKEDDKKRIRQFVTTHEVESLGELKKEVEQKLIDVKICDPAIGSGAFPMGLLRELFFCRSAIEPNIVEKAADIKRHIIQNNIYGVDIERGAVEIARLRFWLALIVDEKSPEVLPNLDFKIMQGNSLLEQYKGVDLSAMTKRTVDVGNQLTFFNDMLDVYCKELRDKLAEYYACPEHNKKVELRSEIAELVKQQLIEQHIYIDFEDLDLSANSQFFLWHTWFHDVFSRPSKEGFDIVIGNPPYIDSETMTNLGLEWERRLLQAKYPNLAGNWDIYMAFFELSLTIGSIVSFITPDKWLSKPFGERFRKNQLCSRLYTITKAGSKVFENVTVDAIITLFTKSSGKIQIAQFSDTKEVNLITTEKSTNLKPPYLIDFLFSEHSKLIQKIDLVKGKLSDLAECENACATSDFYVVKDLIEENSTPNMDIYYKLINTGTIEKYRNRWADKEISYGGKYSFPVVNKDIFNIKLGKSYTKRAASPKIIFKGLNLLDGCIDEDANIIPGKSTIVICNNDIELLKFLLGLLNSKLPIFYIKTKYASSSYCGGITFSKDMVNTIPLPSNQSHIRAIAELVNKILDIKNVESKADTTTLEKKIDEEVYRMYNLSEEEISIVEGI